MNETVTVGIADMKTAGEGRRLVTFALGSCVGICLYDPVMRMGALGHILLPRPPADGGDAEQNPDKFASTCIPRMVQSLLHAGCVKSRLWAKIAGGAQMFRVSGNSEFGKVGSRNVEEVRRALAAEGIPVAAEDVGGDYGRTLFFDTADGGVTVKSYVKGEYPL